VFLPELQVVAAVASDRHEPERTDRGMQHRGWIWLISIAVLLGGCSRLSGNTGGSATNEEKVPEAFVAPEYSTVTGSGSGVVVNGRISRGTLNVGMSNFPTWKVELTVANHTASAVRLGESMMVLEKLPKVDDMAGIYVARESKRTSGRLKRMSTRYGLLWGLSVGLDSPGVWPFAALPGGSSMSTLDLFVLAASVKFVKPYYPDGGYPPVPSGQQVVIREEIVVPLKRDPESTILLPPAVLEEGKAPIHFVLRFNGVSKTSTLQLGNLGATADGQRLEPVDSKSYSVRDPSLAALPDDPTQPWWLRLHALNWLAEARFEETAPILMKYASDQSAPANVRAAALLNLGMHQYKAAVPLLLATLENQNDAFARAVGIAALAEMGDPAVSARIRPLLNDPEETVVRETVAAIGQLKDVESVGPLLNLLVDTKRKKQYDAIAVALTQIGTSEALAGLVRISSDRKLANESRAAAISAIGKAAYPPAVKMLRDIAVDERDDSSLRSSAISALAKTGSPEAWVGIKAASAALEKSVAETALRAMSQSKDNAHRSYVIETAGRTGDRLQEAALKLIYQEKPGGAAPTLRRVLHDPATPASLLPHALKGLTANGDAVGTDDLAPLWGAYQRESDPSVGEALADGLIEAKFDDKSVIPHLVAGLDEDKNKLWYSHIKLLRYLSGQMIGPEYRFGEKKEHKADFDKWREWWAHESK
jgi:HEAT repeat protein